MAATFNVEVQGFENIKALFNEVGIALSAGQVRKILSDPARIVLAKAKTNVQHGAGIDEFRKDLGVYSPRRKRGAEWVYIGPRFKEKLTSGSNVTPVAVVAAHMTEGFKQTSRKGHGKAKIRYANPVLQAWNQTKGTAADGIDKGILKVTNAIKRKYGV